MSLTTLVETRLSEIFGQKNLVEIQTALQKSQAVISGSFIVQCILGEYWEGSDIDIYVPIPEDIPTVMPHDIRIDHDHCEVHDVELNNGIKVKYSCGGYLITEIENVLFHLSDEKEHNGCYEQEGESEGQYCGLFGESIYGMREYIIKNETKQKIQVMQVNTKKLPLGDFIFRSFDFDFCKAFYGVMEKKSFVNCFDLKSIFSKCCEMEYTVNMKKSLERFEKYSKRGFQFTYHGECIKDVYLHYLDVGIKQMMNELSECHKNGEVPVNFVKKFVFE